MLDARYSILDFGCVDAGMRKLGIREGKFGFDFRGIMVYCRTRLLRDDTYGVFACFDGNFGFYSTVKIAVCSYSFEKLVKRKSER